MFKGKAHFDVASVLALIFGFSTIMWILFCIRHVPLDNHDKSDWDEHFRYYYPKYCNPFMSLAFNA